VNSNDFRREIEPFLDHAVNQNGGIAVTYVTAGASRLASATRTASKADRDRAPSARRCSGSSSRAGTERA
jgi:hypothetical protein